MSDLDVSPEFIISTIQQKRMAMLDVDNLNPHKLMLMRDLSRTALDQTRIMVEDKGAKAKQDLAIYMATLVTKVNGNPFESSGGTVDDKILDISALPALSLVEGELSVEQSTLTYTDLIVNDE